MNSQNSFPMLRLGISDSEAYKLKARDCADGVYRFDILQRISHSMNSILVI